IDAVQLTVFCDLQRARRGVESLLGAGPLDSHGLRESLESQRICGVDLTAEVPLTPEVTASLMATGRAVLEAALASALVRCDDPASGDGAPVLDGRRGRLRSEGEIEQATLHHTLGQAYPLLAHAVVDGLLETALSDEERARCVRVVDVDTGELVKE